MYPRTSEERFGMGRRLLPGVLGARRAKYTTDEPSSRKVFVVSVLGISSLAAMSGVFSRRMIISIPFADLTIASAPARKGINTMPVRLDQYNYPQPNNYHSSPPPPPRL